MSTNSTPSAGAAAQPSSIAHAEKPAFSASFMRSQMSAGIAKGSELLSAFGPLKKAAAPVFMVSAVLNILMLSGSFFMLLVYDEVLTSRSLPTLVGLLLMVSVAYAFMAGLDYIRLRIMHHLGSIATGQISTRVMDVVARQTLVAGPRQNAGQTLRDLDQLRSFLSGPAPLAFIDLPWVLLYLAVLTLFHWSLGLLTLAGVAVLVVLMLITDRATSKRVRDIATVSSAKFALADALQRNAEPVVAMGMVREHQRQWLELEHASGGLSDKLTRTSGGLTTTGKSLRMLLQSLVLALGAFLVIKGEATGGIIIAGSILSARALAPVEQSIAHWKSAVSAKHVLSRLDHAFTAVPPRQEPMPLPLPSQTLDVRGLVSGPPGQQKLSIADVNFQLKAGDALAIIGPSGSGKSTLARALCGLWPSVRGEVRLDGATLDQWCQETLGRAIGYIPQSSEMLPGTIAQNIARFDPAATADDIIAAAKAADLHDFILHLDGGYDHLLGPQGSQLSAGQIQRMALARALFRDPFLLVLDEPNSNLDAAGEVALGTAVKAARARGAIVLMVAHRPSVLAYMSHILILNNGRVQEFGLTENVRKGAYTNTPAANPKPSRANAPRRQLAQEA